MTATTETNLTDGDLSLTDSAHTKIRELFEQVEECCPHLLEEPKEENDKKK